MLTATPSDLQDHHEASASLATALRGAAKALIASTPIPEALARHKARTHLTILGYHRIGEAPGPDYSFNEELFSATPEEFEREICFFRRNMDIVSMAELAEGIDGKSALPERPAIITFDDGYVDNHEVALPILRNAGVSACFFLCTGLVGTPNIPWYEEFVCCLKRSRSARIDSPFGGDEAPYDLSPACKDAAIRRCRERLRRSSMSQVPAILARLRSSSGVVPSDFLERPLFMDWDAARDLLRSGMEAGGHTRTHPILSGLHDRAALRAEIAGSFVDLVQELGLRPRAFAYPVGRPSDMSSAADEEIRAAGYRLSFSYENRLAPRLPQSSYRLPRLQTEYGHDYRAFRLGMARASLA